jgi:hypothetical protein
MRRLLPLAAALGALGLATLGLAGCASQASSGADAPAGDSGRSTSDPRVRSFLGQVPPELGADLRWVMRAPAPLASLQGRVVFLQFAFPT